jgi:hypothetical protein
MVYLNVTFRVYEKLYFLQYIYKIYNLYTSLFNSKYFIITLKDTSNLFYYLIINFKQLGAMLSKVLQSVK